MSYFKPAMEIIAAHRRAFLFINVFCLAVVLISMAAAMIEPSLQGYFKPDIDGAYDRPGLFKSVGEAYAEKRLLTAIVMTFLVNTTVAVVMTTLPSLLVPAVGLVAVLQRCVLWGVMFAPIGPHPGVLIPHAPTLLLEGFAYVLAGFAAYVHARMFLRPKAYGLASHGAGYRHGLKAVARLYGLVLLTLGVAATYEVFEAIYLMPHFM